MNKINEDICYRCGKIFREDEKIHEEKIDIPNKKEGYDIIDVLVCDKCIILEEIEVEERCNEIQKLEKQTELECIGKDFVDKGIHKFMKWCEQNDYNFNYDEKDLDLADAEGVIIEAFCGEFTYFSNEEMASIECVQNEDFRWGLDEDGTTYVV